MEAVLVYRLCLELGMRLTVEWVRKDENTSADQLSRLEDSYDYMLDPACFNYMGSASSDIFTAGVPSFSILALKLCFDSNC